MRATYLVSRVETFSTEFLVDAEDEVEAIRLVRDKWKGLQIDVLQLGSSTWKAQKREASER